MNIKDRSWPQCYDYEQTVRTQDDAEYQIAEWQKLVEMFPHEPRGRARAICKIAFWRSILDAQRRRGISFK